MTEQQPLSQRSVTTSRRLAWFAIACAAASLALTTGVRLTGGSVRWTAWTLPVLIAANTSVALLGGLVRWPRLARLFFVASLTLAGAVIVAEIRLLLHR
jgi:hypothetical protein